MRKLFYALVVGVACVAVPNVAHADEIFVARLHGGAEVPPVETDGRGFALVVISDNEASIQFLVAFRDLTSNAVAAHFHAAPPGMDGPIIFDLGVPPPETGGFVSGTLTRTDFMPGGGVDTFDEALDAIRSGLIYVNVHSVNFTGGELRGQLKPF